VLAATLLIAGVVVVARSAPVSQPSLPGLREPDYSRDAAGHISPLRTEFLTQAFGSAALGRIVPIATTTTAKGAAPTTPPLTGNRKAAPDAPAVARSSPPVQHGLVADTFSNGRWDLRLEFAADQAQVAPGKDIVYTLTARNVGAESFVGRLDLRSHVPLLTSYISDPMCAVNTLLMPSITPADACPLPSLPVPEQFQDLDIVGQPVPLTGLTWSTAVTMPPGATFVRSFTVTVSPAAANQVIKNHAHISVLGSAAQRSGDVAVQVTDAVVPQSP
jgi:hypothetical protein